MSVKKSIALGLMTFNIMVRDTEKEVLEPKEMLHKPKKLYIDLSRGGQLADDITFIEYFERWIKVNKVDRVSQSTLNRYYSALNVFEEKFGSILIKDVSQLGYREMLKEYAEGQFIGGRKEGRTKA